MTLLRSVDALIEEAGLTPIVRPPAPVTDTGWERIDLFPWLQGPMPDDSPKLGVRTDGVRVLYPGRIHAINGEPESGKTWLAQFLAAQELAGGHKVLYLDYEDGPAAFASRMAALGVPARIVVTALHYHRIEAPWSEEARAVLATATANGFSLAVIDGVTEAMAACGLDPLGNADVAKWWAMLPKPLTRSGAAVLIIDHVAKDREGRGRWALGAQHKLSAVDGAAFALETRAPFGRGKRGSSTIFIRKDRPGWLRQNALGDRLAEFTLISANRAVTASLEPCVPYDHHAMLDISRILAQIGQATSAQLREHLARRRTGEIDRARAKLVEMGHVRESMEGRIVYYSLTRPYQ